MEKQGIKRLSVIFLALIMILTTLFGGVATSAVYATDEDSLKDGKYKAGTIMWKNNQAGESKSMCDVMFSKDMDIEVKGDVAELKLYVAYPVPKFPDLGTDGTLKDVKLFFNEKEYVADSDIETKPEKVFDKENGFGLEVNKAYPTQVLTFEVPKAALNEQYLTIQAYVNVFMNSTETFIMQIVNIRGEGEEPEKPLPEFNPTHLVKLVNVADEEMKVNNGSEEIEPYKFINVPNYDDKYGVRPEMEDIFDAKVMLNEDGHYIYRVKASKVGMAGEMLIKELYMITVDLNDVENSQTATPIDVSLVNEDGKDYYVYDVDLGTNMEEPVFLTKKIYVPEFDDPEIIEEWGDQSTQFIVQAITIDPDYTIDLSKDKLPKDGYYLAEYKYIFKDPYADSFYLHFPAIDDLIPIKVENGKARMRFTVKRYANADFSNLGGAIYGADICEDSIPCRQIDAGDPKEKKQYFYLETDDLRRPIAYGGKWNWNSKSNIYKIDMDSLKAIPDDGALSKYRWLDYDGKYVADLVLLDEKDNKTDAFGIKTKGVDIYAENGKMYVNTEFTKGEIKSIQQKLYGEYQNLNMNEEKTNVKTQLYHLDDVADLKIEDKNGKITHLKLKLKDGAAEEFVEKPDLKEGSYKVDVKFVQKGNESELSMAHDYIETEGVRVDVKDGKMFIHLDIKNADENGYEMLTGLRNQINGRWREDKLTVTNLEKYGDGQPRASSVVRIEQLGKKSIFGVKVNPMGNIWTDTILFPQMDTLKTYSLEAAKKENKDRINNLGFVGVSDEELGKMSDESIEKAEKKLEELKKAAVKKVDAAKTVEQVESVVVGVDKATELLETKEVALEKAKDKKLAEIDKTTLGDTEGMTEESIEKAEKKLSELKDAAKKAVNNAKDIEAVKAVTVDVDEARKLLETVEAAEARKLEEAKKAKLAEIEEITLGDTEGMTEESIEKAEKKLSELKDAAKKTVDDAKDVDSVKAVTVDVEEARKLLVSKEDVEKEILQKAKEAKLAEIEEIKLSDANKEGKTEESIKAAEAKLKELKEAAKAQVESATSVDQVHGVVVDIDEVIALLEDKSEITDEEKLENAKNAKLEEINNAVLSDIDKDGKTEQSIKAAEDKLKELKKAAKAQVETAKTVEAVNAVKVDMEAVKALLVEKKDPVDPVDPVIPMPEYKVIEGNNQVVDLNKGSSVTFKFDADYSAFENGGKVYVDGKLIKPENYTSKAGSTIISLKKDYIKTLSAGEHTVKVAFNDGGEAEAKFKIAKAEVKPDETKKPVVDKNNATNTSKSPKTGDETGFGMMIILMAMASATVVVFARKRQK